MDYYPQPLDTSKVKLPMELDALLEFLAENTHDHWAKQRFSEGWTYGPKRDDALKKHPGLVRYQELSDSEKNYDRNTALETLKAIVAHGYQIIPPINHGVP